VRSSRRRHETDDAKAATGLSVGNKPRTFDLGMMTATEGLTHLHDDQSLVRASLIELPNCAVQRYEGFISGNFLVFQSLSPIDPRGWATTPCCGKVRAEDVPGDLSRTLETDR